MHALCLLFIASLLKSMVVIGTTFRMYGMTDDHRLIVTQRCLDVVMSAPSMRLKYSIDDHGMERVIIIEEDESTLAKLGDKILWHWFARDNKTNVWIQYDKETANVKLNASYKIPPLLHVKFKLIGYTINSEQPLSISIKKFMTDSVENKLNIGKWDQRISDNYREPHLPSVLSQSSSSVWIDADNVPDSKSKVSTSGC